MEARVEGASSADEPHGATADKVISELKAILQRAELKAAEHAKAADRVVRDHPYPTIGLAFGLGLLIGFLARRK